MKNHGFSLVEIMISVALLAGMALIIQATMGRALESKTRVERKDELLHGVATAMGKLSTDLSQAFVANKSFKGQETQYETGMKGVGDKLDFSTLSHEHFLEEVRDTDQVTVGYYVEKNDSGALNLYRREALRLSDKIDEGGNSYLLVENVKELKFQFYDSNKREWVDEWDTSSVSVLGRLPQAVRVEITIVEMEDEESPENAREYFYSTAVSVDMYKNEINF